MFPGALAETPADGDYAIVGAPLDRSASFRPGARFGPERVRSVATGFEDFDHRTDQEFTELDVYDHGDVRPWSEVSAYLEFLAGECRDLSQAGACPLLIGGEHTVTIGALRAIQPETLICFDAHLDLRKEFDGSRWSHATVVHHALEIVDEVIILGARAGSASEWERGESDDCVTIVPAEGVANWDPGERSAESIYVSVDMDVFEAGLVPGTGTPEPFGLRPRSVRDLLHELAADVVGFDIVEITDRDDDQTATLAAKLLREFVFAHAHEHR